MRLRLSPFLMAFAAAGAVEIIPPSPYMSSPPPVQADTSVIDPGRKPQILTVEPGLQEQWYSDWDLVTDRPSTAPLEVTAPRKGSVTFRVAFNDHGWPTEVGYYDVNGKPRWTKLFRYPTKLPAGPGDVSFVPTWINSKGDAISMSKVSETYKATEWKAGLRKYKISDLLGEPLLVESHTGNGPAETWSYLVDGKEVVFPINKDNQLISAPAAVEPKVEAAKPATPAPTPAAVETPTTKKKSKK
jgi:hypothetical protein